MQLQLLLIFSRVDLRKVCRDDTEGQVNGVATPSDRSYASTPRGRGHERVWPRLSLTMIWWQDMMRTRYDDEEEEDTMRMSMLWVTQFVLWLQSVNAPPTPPNNGKRPYLVSLLISRQNRTLLRCPFTNLDFIWATARFTSLLDVVHSSQIFPEL